MNYKDMKICNELVNSREELLYILGVLSNNNDITFATQIITKGLKNGKVFTDVQYDKQIMIDATINKVVEIETKLKELGVVL